MEPLSPSRFHGERGYNGYGINHSRGSNAPVNYHGEKSHDHERRDHHPSLASPSRFKQQQVAQKMINVDYLNNDNLDKTMDRNYHAATPRRSRENYDFGHDSMAEMQLIPPWETPTNAAAVATAAKPSRNDYVDCYTEPAAYRLQPVPSNNPPFDNRQWEHVRENRQPSRSTQLTTHSEILQSPPKSTKNVSFNTRDKIHQWDDQLDQLKYVDEEFFGVAQFLLEDVHNLTDDFLDKEEEDFELLHALQGNGDWKTTNGAPTTAPAAGVGILSKLFQCVDYKATSAEESYEADDYKPYLGVDGEILDDGVEKNKREKKYKLTDKLIKDFREAVSYRMQKVEDRDHEDGEEDSIAAKTREIARKMDAYGLPTPRGMSLLKDDDDVVAKSNSVRLVRSEKSQPRRNDTHFFPLLPTDNDDDEDVGALHEKEHRHRSNKVTADSSAQSKSSLLSFFSSFFKSKSTPSEEQCQQQLSRIGREIRKVELMNDTTRNAAVQTACARRIAKLNDEKRFYQIIKEQYKIRQMFKTTTMEGVKFACKERMKQLMIELESLDLEKGKDFNITVESKEGVKGHDQKDEDVNWYQRVLQYVNATNNDQYNDQHEPAAQHINYQDDIPSNNEQMQQQYPHQYDQQNNDYNNKLLPLQYQQLQYPQQSFQYHHQEHNHMAHQARGPRKTEVPIQENRHAPFDSQPSYYSEALHHSLPQHHHIHPGPRKSEQVYESSPIPSSDHQSAYHNEKIRMPPRTGNNTTHQLPLATPLPPKKEGLNKLISYLAP
ncbi:hypothetical protein HJC23_012866 [Cyclotella cryptica]|uniref:Uncharacterized protein n=1 Tax=Cyclotella cryptica TaxID=29204 RepID=A0ABD3Q2V7_9STRA|eukprot:CCRYP_009459-RA/>CCRYP_009459-RA protein AED:0.07 eAED:0.07 QI:146/1/1/1/0.25/0.2/5/2041/773